MASVTPVSSPTTPTASPRLGRGLAPLLAAVLVAAGAARPSAAVARQASSHADGPTASAATEAGLLLRQLGSARRVLLIAAHPDDEDTALLAELDRSRGVRTAYLSLTRGEGGQNVIGPELGAGLGLIRTGELLAARRLDGAEQYFTRAYDFGYSKTAEETFRHWPRDELLRDVVWRIRRFRPHVVVSIFSGTPADGHGHHQVAGILARRAFEAAADSTRFPQQLDRGVEPWAAYKLYRRAWRDPDRATLRVPTGDYDPLLGRSPFQLAMEGRSQHRSQGFGTVQPPGPRFTRLLLVANRTNAAPDAPLFAAVDTTLAGIAAELAGRTARAVREQAAALRRAADAARDSLRVLDASAAVPALRRSLAAAREAERLAESSGAIGARTVFARQVDVARRALLAAAGISLRFRAEDDLWVPGETIAVHAELWNGSGTSVGARAPELRLPQGWGARLLPADSVRPIPSERSRFYGSRPALAGGEGSLDVPPGQLARWTFRVTVPESASPTEQYFLRRDRAGDLYRWPDDPELRGEPHSPPLATGRLPVRLDAAGGEVAASVSREVRYRGVDKARGEFWRPVYVVPRVSVSARPDVLISPARDGPAGEGAAAPDSVTVTVRSQVEDSIRADLSLRLPEGWSAEPDRGTVRLAGRGASETRSFAVRKSVGAAAGATDAGSRDSGRPGRSPWTTHLVAAEARAAPPAPGSATAGAWSSELSVIDYPHIDPVPLFRDAALRMERFPVKVDRGRRVGYVMGTGDDVPAAIRQLGLPVTMIDESRLRSGDLEAFDVIVLGVRAYEVREDLQAANPRLLEWVRDGGTLLVQYNKYEFVDGDYAPFRATMARPHDRVTDEGAEVTLLRPESPVLSSPNDIGDRDFRGWVQERGLYFLHEWGEAFTSLLSMSDPGEGAKRGSLLVAPLGEGLYVYTGLAFFRQLPAGVPGAYRLFANLLSLEPGEWRSWSRAARAPGGRP